MAGVCFSQEQLQAIADALGDTDAGLTGSEIGHLLASAKITDTDPSITKRIRIYNAFAGNQNHLRNRTHIIAFIRKAMKPARFVRDPDRFEPMRLNCNRALSFAGISVNEAGELIPTKHSTTLTEATQRARLLRADLVSRGVHEDVLKFCKAELLADNYFHAVLEAVKSISDKLRTRTGLTDDGAPLVDNVFSGTTPLLIINPMATKSQNNEQKGFVNLIKGVIGMFRNTTAHEARINWDMSKEDAEDLLSMVSLIHRRIDGASKPS